MIGQQGSMGREFNEGMLIKSLAAAGRKDTLKG
jgi:hypothetical protein